MNIVLLTTVVLVSTLSKAWAADGDAVLTGYLVIGNNICLDVTGTGVTNMDSTSENDLAAKCIRLLIEETATGMQYLIKKSDNQGDILVLADGDAPTYDGTGTAIQFSDVANIKDPVTTLNHITSGLSPVRIQLAGKDAADTSCLTDVPDYKDTGCTVAWYFVEAACQVSDCAACSVDVTLCNACPGKTHVLSGDKKTCQACDDTFPDCIECSDLTACLDCTNSKVPSTDRTKCVTCDVVSCDKCSDDNVCDVCIASLKPNGVGSGCYDCSSIANCEKCESAGQCSGCSSGMIPNSAGNACEACVQGKTISTDGTMCVDCSGVTGCESCSADQVCGKCTGTLLPNDNASACYACSGVTGCESCSADNVCGKCTGNLLPNDNASACYDCSTIIDCEKCKAEGECSACSSGMLPNAKGDACVATRTTEATTASDAGTNTVSVLVIIGMALLTLA